MHLNSISSEVSHTDTDIQTHGRPNFTSKLGFFGGNKLKYFMFVRKSGMRIRENGEIGVN